MYPFFSVFLLFAIFTFIFMRKTSGNDPTGSKSLIEKEREANSVRKQPITDLTYISLDLSALPEIETEDEYLIERIKMLTHLSDESVKIVDLSMYSNTDLKFKYGVANLTILTEYDQNYIMLIRCLYEIGKRLYDNGDKSNAKAFLEYGINIGTNLKLHYTLLADIYEENLQYKDIIALISKAESIDTPLKSAIIRDLKSRLEGTNYSVDDSKKNLEDITTT